MTEEQYKETLVYRMNELNLAFADLLVAFASISNRLYRRAIKYRVSVIEKVERDYYDYVDGDLPTRLEGSE